MLKKTYIIDNIAFFLTFFLRKYKKTVSILIHHVKSQKGKNMGFCGELPFLIIPKKIQKAFQIFYNYNFF